MARSPGQRPARTCPHCAAGHALLFVEPDAVRAAGIPFYRTYQPEIITQLGTAGQCARLLTLAHLPSLVRRLY